MATVQDAAAKAAANFAGLTGQTEAAFDPTTILVFANLIIPIIQQIQKCIAARKVPAAAASPNLRQQIVVRSLVRREVGIRAFREEGMHYINALLKTAADTSEDDMEAIFADAEKN